MAVIVNELEQKRPFPSLRRIADLMGKSNRDATNGIRITMNRMVERGWLEKEDGKWRKQESGAARITMLRVMRDLVEWNKLVAKSESDVWKMAEEICQNAE